MKRFCSIVLALVLVFSMTVPSYAKYDSVAGGQTQTIGYYGYIDRQGGLWLWGPNNTGSAGQPRTQSWVDKPTKVLDEVVAFCRNDFATIVLKKDGSVWTFGKDYAPERASRIDGINGAWRYRFNDGYEPVKRLENCTAVSVGTYPSFAALGANGTVYTWADPSYGALGFGVDDPNIDISYYADQGSGQRSGYIVKPFPLMSDVKAISMGRYYGIAIKNDNSLWFWGSAPWYDKLVPGDVPPGVTKVTDGVSQVSAEACMNFVKTDGTVWTCGQKTTKAYPYGGIKFSKRYQIASGAAKVSGMYSSLDAASGNYYDYAYILKKDGTLYAKDGAVKLFEGVNDAYIFDGGDDCDMVLLNDGRLFFRDTFDGTYTQIASDVALSGKPFSSIQPPEDPSLFIGGFRDVRKTDWFANPVQWAVEKGITSGTTPTTFSPNQTCSVKEILTFLWVSQGAPTPERMTHFSNVDSSAWYAKAANWAWEQELVGDDTFYGDDPCTRLMTVTYLWTLEGSPNVRAEKGVSTVLVDVPYAIDAPVQWAMSEGITNGINRDSRGVFFGPEVQCTRAQIMTFLYTAYELR